MKHRVQDEKNHNKAHFSTRASKLPVPYPITGCIDKAEPRASAALTLESPLALFSLNYVFTPFWWPSSPDLPELQLEHKERHGKAEDLRTTKRSIPFSKYTWYLRDFYKMALGKELNQETACCVSKRT